MLNLLGEESKCKGLEKGEARPMTESMAGTFGPKVMGQTKPILPHQDWKVLSSL
jgi:hypothetical protein